jgi:uncharacterized protein (TIGR03118 family)
MLSKKLQTVSHLAGLTILSLLAIAMLSMPAAAQKVNVAYLTSDITSVGPFQDTNLVNPWGMSISPTGPWWISDNGTGLSTLYSGTGQAQSLVVTIPTGTGSGTGTPSGTVFNASTTDFEIHGFATPFLFCTEDGTISGWYTGTNAFLAVNNNSEGAVYKGMALASAGGANYLYVANFHAGTIEAYDRTYAPHSFGSGAFVDSTIPAGYAPFNIQLIGTNRLVVTYAKQDTAKHDDVPGPGNGFVDIYDTQGNLQLRLAHNLYFNAPWAVVLVPANGFSGFNGDLLIGNFGSGAVMAFNPNTGVWIGNMQDVNDLPLKIDGLWGLAFGNGGSGGSATTLFFTAGPFGESHGIFGALTPHTGL